MDGTQHHMMLAQFLGNEDHGGMKKDAVLLKLVYLRAGEGEALYFCTLYHRVQKRGNQSPVSKQMVWRLLDEQNMESAKLVCN
jgi:hypothetical protein